MNKVARRVYLFRNLFLNKLDLDETSGEVGIEVIYFGVSESIRPFLRRNFSNEDMEESLRLIEESDSF